MFCQNCGTKNADNASFCVECGSSLHNKEPLSVPSSTELDWKWGLFSFEGRINRQRYWTYWLIGFLMMSPLIVAARLTEAAGPFMLIAMYGIGFTLGAKRWRDLNQSGWLAVLAVIPFVNLILGFIEGTKGDNQYGADIANI